MSLDLPTEGIRSFGFQRETHKHNGIDLRAELGTPIHAAARGVVVHATHAWQQGFTGYGRVVVIQAEDGTQQLYAHLDRPLVGVGQPVQAGDVIGRAGRTAFSKDDHESLTRGAHLHFEVSPFKYPQPNTSARIDPVSWLQRHAHIHPVAGVPVVAPAPAPSPAPVPPPADEGSGVAEAPFVGADGAPSSARSSGSLPHCPSCTCSGVAGDA